MPEVSFIVPVYNAEKGVGKLIESVLNQEYRDLELILVDDGSKDGSPAILDQYQAKDERVKVIHKPNGGVSAARNDGLQAASGTYIRFLDADDWIPDDSTKEMVRAIKERSRERSPYILWPAWMCTRGRHPRPAGLLPHLKGPLRTSGPLFRLSSNRGPSCPRN